MLEVLGWDVTNGIEREVPAPQKAGLTEEPRQACRVNTTPWSGQQAQPGLQMTRETSLVIPELGPSGRTPW